MKNIYLLSGLGADERTFQHLEFSNFKKVHLHWIKPGDRETIQQYASRLAIRIQDPKPILIGLSFGGILAVEIGKIIETEKIILISSAQEKKDIPFYFRLAGKLGIHKAVPVSFFKRVNVITYWFFGVKNKKERGMLKSILQETDSVFLKWALNAIVKWENEVRLENVIKIHGTNDRILPITTADYHIEQGGHLMIINKHREINQIINTLVNG